MRRLTIRNLFSDVTRDVAVEGIDPFDRVVKIRYGGGAGLYRFSYESGQGVGADIDSWVVADLDALRAHVHSLGLKTGPRLEPTQPALRTRKGAAPTVDENQLALLGGVR